MTNNKHSYLLAFVFLLPDCMASYPTTSFYVKNNSDKTLNFKASVIKFSSAGSSEMTLPFAVPPRDSVLARRVGLKKGAEPTAWFTKFVIFPADGISFNDPNVAGNWVPSTDANGKPVYTFTMTKK